MLLRHSLSLTISNSQLIFKTLLYALIVFIIVAALFVTISTPILDALGEELDLAQSADTVINELFEGDGKIFERVFTAIDHLKTNHAPELIKSVIFGAILVVLMKFFIAWVVCPIAFIINQKMASNFTSGFFHAVVSVGWKRSIVYAILYTLISAPFDIAVIVATYYLAKWMVGGIGLIGLIIPIVFALVLITLRMCIMGQWVAHLVNEDIKFGLIFKRSFKLAFKMLPKFFTHMMSVNLIVYAIIAATAVFTVGIIPIVMVPFALVVTVTLHLVAYYQENDKKFYVDERIVENKADQSI
ncbi:MAG: hypothetical protein J6V83_03420 [Clostridia bacterium]|nr:hypothetical protein [Clostridia bacterium]MBO7156436.1 hypothetical protein [Clostridia bacterium]